MRLRTEHEMIAQGLLSARPYKGAQAEGVRVPYTDLARVEIERWNITVGHVGVSIGTDTFPDEYSQLFYETAGYPA